MITHFNENSHFVYDIDEANNYLNKIGNKNLLKLNENELNTIKIKIEQLEYDKVIEKGNQYTVFLVVIVAPNVQNFSFCDNGNKKVRQ